MAAGIPSAAGLHPGPLPRGDRTARGKGDPPPVAPDSKRSAQAGKAGQAGAGRAQPESL